LKLRFNLEGTNSLFLAEAEQKNVPIDGMAHFVQSAWQSIREQKELNLPDQRAMVANYRCTELKEEALRIVEPQVLAL
jgi:protein SEY1